MKKLTLKLQLNKESIRILQNETMQEIRGGYNPPVMPYTADTRKTNCTLGNWCNVNPPTVSPMC